MKFIDISVKGFSGQFTRVAKKFDLNVQIILKVPKADLTTVRIVGEHKDLILFLSTGLQPLLSNSTAAMHIAAIKNFKEADVLVPLKNRMLAENRST